MSDSSPAYLPTLQDLLGTEVLAEAQVLVGKEKLSKVVSQVVSSFIPIPKADSLVVTSLEAALTCDQNSFSNLSAILAISGSDQPNQKTELEKLSAICEKAGIPLVGIPTFGEFAQIAEDVRAHHLKEVRMNGIRLQADLLNVVLVSGLEGLVERLNEQTNRPIAIETDNFKLLASWNMSATPASQQRNIAEQINLLIKQGRLDEQRDNVRSTNHFPVVKAGRRLVVPILAGDSLVGYVAAMTKANDSLETLTEYLQAAATAACVDFYQRSKDGSILAVTQKSLLKDLVSGRSLSAADQERVERYYGFDLCDGLLVFACATTSGEPLVAEGYAKDNLAFIEVEGTSIFVVPYNQKEGHTWQKVAESFSERLRQFFNKQASNKIKIQLGTSRVIANILALSEAYREARQALIIGSMIQGDEPFILGYGDLGVKRLLYLIIDHPELERFYEENLAPLISYDLEWESELVPSLKVYLEHGANLNSTARALFIHRHTLRYRLEQIAEILAVNIDSQETLLNLQIAFLIKDMKHSAKKPASV